MHVNTADNRSNELILDWGDDTRSVFHAIWLRDNCHCVYCGEPSIGRRALRLSEIDVDLTIEDASVEAVGGLQEVTIRFSDDHHSSFSSSWLYEHRYDEDGRRERAFKPQPWSQELRSNPPVLRYQDVVEDDRHFLKLLHIVRDHGICFIKNAPLLAGTLEGLAGRIGPVQESNFGRVQDLIVDRSRRGIANDIIALKPHTDEPYRASPPGLLLFHCIETDSAGAGRSTFLDGFEAAEALREQDPEGFRILTQYNQAFRRHYDGDVDLVAEFPSISTDQFDNVCGVRVNDRVTAPLCIDQDVVPTYYRAMKSFLALTEDSDRMLNRSLAPGDMAIFDNHRILHGRTRLTVRGRRWLQWTQVERGDFYSRMRILADRLGVDRDASALLRGAY